MGGYSDFIVSFIREYVDEENKTKNVTVGRCSSTDRHPLEHRGMRIHYNASTKSIVMELPTMIDQQDTGSYYCDVKIRNAESNELILHGKGMVMIDTDPESNPTSGPEPKPTMSSPTPVALVIVIVFMAVVIVFLIGVIVYIKYQQRHEYQQLAGDSKEF